MTGYLAKVIPRYASLTQPLRELTRNETKFDWGPEEQDAFEKLKQSISNDDTIEFFQPERPTVVRTEANYNERLSAGLFQRTERGWQPVHFISRTLTDVERRYSQTKKDALCVKWTNDRFSMYLMGAPKFTIVTAQNRSHLLIFIQTNPSKPKTNVCAPRNPTTRRFRQRTSF
jgi:hypothetical protein